MKKSSSVREILDFIRFKISFFSLFIGVLGFILANQISHALFLAALSSFCICAGSFAYNNVTDTREDVINRGEINSLAGRKEGMLLIFILFSLGLIFSFFLSRISFFFSITMTFVGVVYSLFRLKRYFLIKNFYIGLCLPILFLIGAGALNAQIIFYYILLFAFFFAGSLIADLRDCEGDGKTGLATLPVKMGYRKVQVLTAAILAYVSFLIMYLGLRHFFPISFLSFVMLMLLVKDKIKSAHFLGGISILATVVWWFL